ncbi:MAG: HD domain-containing protein [Lachnospiraceae bacterium]|nr:HD domain-containing protein [Lachnospiraceae bacterium]
MAGKKIAHLLMTVSLLLGALLVISPCRADAAIGQQRNIFGTGTDYTAILYDSSNGLPTSEANAIVQSADGFIWIGGYSGLIRYDGTNFQRFDSSTGISSVFSLYVDSKDRVWIGTNENGIAYYDHGEIHVYGRVEGLKSYSIRDMVEDRDGNILIATTEGLAYVKKDDLTIHVIDDPQVNLEYITALKKDDYKNVYGLTLDGAVFTVENLRISAFYDSNAFGNYQVNSLYPDPKEPGIVYMGTTGSEIYTANMNNTLEITARRSTAPLKNITDMIIAHGLKWVCATNGLGYFDEHGQLRQLNDIPMNNSVGHIRTDHEGNMWFTSTRQGVLKLVPDRFTDLSSLIGLESMVINTTCLSGAELYLGTDSGLKVVNTKTNNLIFNKLCEYVDGVRIRCIIKDATGRLWLATHGDLGLVCYDPESGSITCFNENNGLDSTRVRDVIQCSNGAIAAATGNGVYLIENNTVTAHYGHEHGINTTEILSVEQGPDGRLYLGSDGDGIYIVDGNKVTRIGYDDGLTSEVVMRIKWDEERKVFWLITSNSIEYLKDGNLTAITNFPYSNNYDIFFDERGYAWILSSNGVYITKADQLLANQSIDYSFYNTKSGLPYVATGNSRSCVDERGNLYIAGTTGVSMVNINSDTLRNDALMLSIPSVEVDGKKMLVGENGTVSLPAGSKRLDINAYVLTYGLANPRISYYLQGFDQEPIRTTKQEMPVISYTNLDGGTYTFHLDVLNAKTGETDKSATITITKESSPYEHVGFWIALMVVSVFVLTTVIWQRFQKRAEAYQKKQEEDEKFISQIMHTFAKCIDMRDTQNRGHSFRVAYYTKMLAEELKSQRGYTKEQINEFYNIALLHDIGKLSIPDVILNKPERLNDEEYEVMKQHAPNGAELLKDVTIVQNLAVGAGCHHERIDGRGYPNHLSGDEIPDVARIIAVADTFDAMYSTRPYRKQLDLSVVLDEIKRIRGSQLDPDVVDALLKLAFDGKLDKAKVDAAIGDEPMLASLPKEELEKEIEKEQARKESQAREDEDFLNDLGLGN